VSSVPRIGDILAALKVGLVVGASGAAATAVAAAAGLTSGTAIAPVAVVLCFLTTSAHYWKTQQARISTEASDQARRHFGALEQQIAETQGLVQLGSLGLPYPLAFGGDYALTADAAAVLARQVALCRPNVVVELGSGVSTILVGKLLQEQGRGRIYSLDHDTAWAEETRKQIRAAGLQDQAEVLDAPLRRQEVDGQNFLWYDIPPTVKDFAQIDLLIVDGPPQATDPGGLPRYPALPMLLPQLSLNATIFIDDAGRPGETEMVRRWLERFPGWQKTVLQTGPGTCLLYRNPSARGQDTRIR
jgi:predicted O-methyltransferase YrrM